MDDVVNRLARELAEAIGKAVSEDPQVEACREKARTAGFEMKVTLEAVVGFVNRSEKENKHTAQAAASENFPKVKAKISHAKDITANDRRFLRSLRISADEPKKEEVE